MPAQQGAGAETGPGGVNGVRSGGLNGVQHGDRAPTASASRAEVEPAPASGRLEATQVRAMFDGIAGVYDLLNTAMTAGLHHRWRERAVDLAAVRPGSRVLDVATGTGDLAFALARRVAPDGEVLASDFAEGMLARARVKAESLQSGPSAAAVSPRFEWGDALALDHPDDTFDAATVGFGARNFDDLPRGLAELARVVRPGGRVVVLEITTPVKPPLSLFYRLWFDRLVPALGRLTESSARALATLRGGQDRGTAIADAYRYLPNSVKRFPPPAELAGAMERAGLCEISYLLLAGGIVAIHAGTVPAERAR
jgi:demethylmenaquinone methyltransferase/2-methoxy-6-polyprenyl-1,4-benzoquinol methylase